jgi:hypothetical protein
MIDRNSIVRALIVIAKRLDDLEKQLKDNTESEQNNNSGGGSHNDAPNE